MTNNTAERAVKPFVIQRMVFQTSGSYAVLGLLPNYFLSYKQLISTISM